jgi:hypothetical protein
VSRLLIFWTGPRQLKGAQAEAWARSEARRLLEVDGARSAELTRLGSASVGYSADHQWLLEVQLAPDADPRECVEHEIWRTWLGELRLLRLQPRVLLAGAAIDLG